jgi:hypothetical protein
VRASAADPKGQGEQPPRAHERDHDEDAVDACVVPGVRCDGRRQAGHAMVGHAVVAVRWAMRWWAMRWWACATSELDAASGGCTFSAVERRLSVGLVGWRADSTLGSGSGVTMRIQIGSSMHRSMRPAHVYITGVRLSNFKTGSVYEVRV